MNIDNEIIRIEEKLAKLRLDWKAGSPSMRLWIERGAKLLIEQKTRLEKRAKSL
jgi:hypothetical protein